MCNDNFSLTVQGHRIPLVQNRAIFLSSSLPERWFVFQQRHCLWRHRAHITQKYRKKQETMLRADQNNAEMHAKVEYLSGKKLKLRLKFILHWCSVTPWLKACARKRPRCDLTKSLWEELFGELGQRNLAKQEGVTAREEHPVLQCQHTYGSRKPEKILNKKENWFNSIQH